MPRPRQVTTCSGSLVLDDRTSIAFEDDPAVRPIALRLGRWLGIDASRVVPIAHASPDPEKGIVLRASTPRAGRDPAVSLPRDVEEEAYALDVSGARAVVRARTAAGLAYGSQTLAQLAGVRPIVGGTGVASPSPLPCVHIDDAPRFAFRAMHLDVARHFFDKQTIERFVDLLSFYRFNVFHWHLTDDQGFRLAIRSHPELTNVGARRQENGVETGGFYTQDEAREVVAFAKERFVTVVPEVETPGHARAILASHPELSCTGKTMEVPATWGIFEDVLCAGNDATYALLDDVLGEVAEVFPSKLIHVGGDEVPKTRWEACPKCRARMKSQHLSSEALGGYFMHRVRESLGKRGRRALAWDEVLEMGSADDAVVVAWQGAERGAKAARDGHDVIMAPHEFVYFNKRQSRSGAEPGHDEYLPLSRVLGFDPMPAGLSPSEAAHVLGGQGALWTEFVRTPEDVDTLLMPRLAALSEALWSVPVADATAREASFASRSRAQRSMMDRAGIGYFVNPPVGLRAKQTFLDQAQITLALPSLYTDGIVRFTTDGRDPTPSSPAFVSPVDLKDTTSVAARLFLPSGRTSPVVRGVFERTTPSPAMPAPLASLQPGVNYTYVEGDFRRLPDFAKLVGRRGRLPALGFDPSFRKERFAVLYEGFLDVPETGVYRFVATSDDGVALEIDGRRILEDDGTHPERDSDGDIALAAGRHAVRIPYFQGTMGKALSITMEGPHFARAPMPIVASFNTRK
ncbi:Beta-hexosaminidase [Labilithrix luteola]|uniref:beta-N-acetylhexosaminidase n=1 Tax=Labilithrix luteola TaxID=1391654 RepID=A0A0K1PSY1_9BACT|nr:family 20 glycosylhydrolase [Labilithrix luteola]AKU96627.1 Beta-hexosaminidase [Labilithrix luteola]